MTLTLIIRQLQWLYFHTFAVSLHRNCVLRRLGVRFYCYFLNDDDAGQSPTQINAPHIVHVLGVIYTRQVRDIVMSC